MDIAVESGASVEGVFSKNPFGMVPCIHKTEGELCTNDAQMIGGNTDHKHA